MAENIKEYIGENMGHFVEELKEWLSIPSISTLTEFRKDVYRAGKWAESRLADIGFPKVEFIEGSGHPLVYAEWLGKKQQPTLLVYGHYDVQPVDPIKEWHSDPFEPRVENDYIYARGATDDKGQIMIVLAALKAWVEVEGELPVNIKILLEGEEEAGGESVDSFVHANSDKLSCDAALICDTHMNSIEQPSIINGLRGILYTEVAVQGAQSDLHSGSYGGVAPNPLHALCLLIAELKGEDGRINIPGVYDNPVVVAEEEISFWRQNRQNLEERLLEEMGVDTLVGEEQYTPHERLGVRPTLEVHGIRGGFTGEGAKTVIPAHAVAKVSLRLPAGRKPAEVFTRFEEEIKKKIVKGYRVDVTNLHGGEGVSVSPANEYIKAAAEAINAAYGKFPVYMREGGSIPIAALFDSLLDVPVVLMGFGLPDDGAHGPNEKFCLTQFQRGIVTLADYLGRIKR